MLDKIVRKAFHETILKSAHADSDTIVVNELGLKNGNIRADIAVLNGKLVGYEIKTEKDNLLRLPAQINAYSEVFDKAFLIVSNKHFNKALELIPAWWGIYQIKQKKNGEYFFKCYRSAKINKCQNNITLAQLLWKKEAVDLINNFLHQRIKVYATKKDMYDVISASCKSRNLSKVVIQYLKQRDNWRADPLSLSKSDD